MHIYIVLKTECASARSTSITLFLAGNQS